MRRSNSYGMLIGTGVLGGAAIALGVATFSAMLSDTATAESMSPPVAEVTPSTPSGKVLEAARIASSASETVQWEDVQLATGLAPFEENRVWSGERYQLPEDRVVVQTQSQERPREPEPAPAFEVLGIASSAGSGLAIIRVGNGTPQLVALGGRMEGYEVGAIENGRVTMRNADRSISLSVASAVASPAQAARADAQRRTQGGVQGNAVPRGGNASTARTPAGLRAPLSASAIEEGMRRVEGIVESMGPGAQVQINGSEVTVQGANGQRLFFDIERPPAAPAQRRQ